MQWKWDSNQHMVSDNNTDIEKHKYNNNPLMKNKNEIY